MAVFDDRSVIIVADIDDRSKFKSYLKLLDLLSFWS